MAKAEAITKVTVQPDGVSLMLDQEEAVFLRSLLGNCITGSTRGPRGLGDAIYWALQEAGIKSDEDFISKIEGNRHVFFKYEAQQS